MMTPADAALSRFLGLIAASRKPSPRACGALIESTDAIQRGSTASSPSAGRVHHCRTPKSNNDAPRISLTTPEADGPPLPCFGIASDRSVKVTTASVMPSTHPAKNPKLVLFAFGDSSINTAAMMASGPTAMPTLKGRISPMTARIASIPFLHRAAVLVGEMGGTKVPSLKRLGTRLLEPPERRITLPG